MRTVLIPGILGIGLTALRAIPTPPSAQEATLQEVQFHRVHLKNGNFIDGRLIRDTREEVTLGISIGEIALRRDLVDRIELIRIRHITESPRQVPRTEVPAVRATPPAPSTVSPPERPTLPPASSPSIPDELKRSVDSILGMTDLAVSNEDRKALVDRLVALGKNTLPYLHQLLDQPIGENTKEVLCLTLAAIRDSSSLEPLARILNQRNPRLQETAIKALGSLGLPECTPLLISALDQESSDVARTASSELARLAVTNPSWNVPAQLVKRLPNTHNKGVYTTTLGRMGTAEARHELLKLLEGGNEDLAFHALDGLMFCAIPDDGPEVMRALHSEKTDCRAKACSVLGKIRHKPAIPELINCLRDENKEIAAKAHAALKAISGEEFGPDPDTWRNWWDHASRQEP